MVIRFASRIVQSLSPGHGSLLALTDPERSAAADVRRGRRHQSPNTVAQIAAEVGVTGPTLVGIFHTAGRFESGGRLCAVVIVSLSVPPRMVAPTTASGRPP